MLVRIIGAEQALMVDLPAEINWSNGNHHTIKFTLQRRSSAWGNEIIDERGGFLIVAETQWGRGRWIADTAQPVADGLVFPGLAMSQWLEKNHVVSNRRFTGALAGHVIQAAFRSGIDGRVPLKLGQLLMAPPLVDINFTGQSLMGIIDQLAQDTGHEWWIDDDLQFHWAAYQGRYHERWLCDDGRFLRDIQQPTLLDTQSEVIEIEPSGASFSAKNGYVPVLWPTQKVVKL